LLIDSSEQLAKVWETCSSHPDDKVLVSDIKPLVGCVISCFSVCVLVLNVWLPSNVCFVNRYIGNSVCIGEDTLCDETTWISWAIWIWRHWLLIQKERTSGEVRIGNDRGASIFDLINCALCTSELFGVLRLDVATMVLVKVVQLIVNVNWWLNRFIDWQLEWAWFCQIGATLRQVIVLLWNFLDLVTHDVKGNT